MSGLPVFARGECVEVFYRMGRDEGCYMPVATPSAGTLRPRVGRSDGWMSARIEEDWPPPASGAGPSPSTERVRVRHMHPYWCNRRGERLDPFEDRDMVLLVQPSDLRRPMPDYKPALSVFSVRWGGEATQFNNEQWGAASSSVSDSYAEAVLDDTLYRRLGPNYEVITAWVESGADMRKLNAPTIFQLLRGRHLCALYFLWPVMAQVSCPRPSGGKGQSEAALAMRITDPCVRQCTLLPGRFRHRAVGDGEPDRLLCGRAQFRGRRCAHALPARVPALRGAAG